MPCLVCSQMSFMLLYELPLGCETLPERCGLAVLYAYEGIVCFVLVNQTSVNYRLMERGWSTQGHEDVL